MTRSAQEEIILMNSRERVLKALALQKSDRVPVVPFIITFAAKYAGFKFIEYARDSNILAKSQIAMARRFKIDAVYVDSDPGDCWTKIGIRKICRRRLYVYDGGAHARR